MRSYKPVRDSLHSAMPYNCTGIPPAALPAAIRCDSILHCLKGEDEEDCAATLRQCG